MQKHDPRDVQIIETDKVKTTFKTMSTGTQPLTLVECNFKGLERTISQVIQMPLIEYSKTGGTNIPCPSCKEVRICEAIEPGWLGLANTNERRLSIIHHSDISWFRRGRRCRTCFYEFLTAELPEEFLYELVRLRDDIISGKCIEVSDLAKYGGDIVPLPNK